ncbi:MAG: metallophosphoesterase [Nitrospinae bacterium]|nr:metallophosphoesterase [Nitrospinota bacterium]MBL7021004.1 metallophosphoesterase [Nitrospinaceae bacterium]
MKWFTVKIIFLLTLALFVNYSLSESAPRKTTRGIQKVMAPFPQGTVTRITIVGDTGTGERAYAPGFSAVQKAMRDTMPDALLHLGDFVYQPEPFPDSCPDRYIKEIKKTLVGPYPLRLFVAGDNDLPANKNKPKGSGCWDKIDPLDSGFDNPHGQQPRAYEGTRVVGNALIGVIHNYPWQDPTEWLKPRIEKAREKGLWVILAVHEPALTTAWYVDKRDTVLKQLNALKPDIVFAGNQHSYERFHPIGPDGKVIKSESGKYQSSDGTMHIVSGGGGATFKPFADQQKNEEHTAPKDVFDALAKRALMNHFITLDISRDVLTGTVWRVCVKDEPYDHQNPRWRSRKEFWNSITLECDGKPEGVTVYEEFEIKEKTRKPYSLIPPLGVGDN